MFYNRFVELCKEKGMSPAAVAREIGLSNSSTTTWKRGSIPKGETLQKVADYFDVSVDYLLYGRGEVSQTHLTNGLHIFKNTFPFQDVAAELKSLPDNSYQIVYQDKNTLIIVDNDSTLTDKQLSQILDRYVPQPIWGSEIMKILTSESERLGVSENELSRALLTQKPDGGGSYLLIKETLSFFFDSIYSKENKPQDKLLVQFNRLNLSGQYTAIKRVEELTEIPRYRAETAPQSPAAPAEGKDTTPPSDGSESPPEGK